MKDLTFSWDNFLGKKNKNTQQSRPLNYFDPFENEMKNVINLIIKITLLLFLFSTLIKCALQDTTARFHQS